MKIKVTMMLVLLCTFLTPVLAQENAQLPKPTPQEDKIARLMGEREQLVLEYQYLNQQNNNFWGNKSKKDLMNIIDTLKELIRKDSELIAAVKEASIKKIAATTVQTQRADKQTVTDQRQVNARIKGLQDKVTAMERQVAKRERTIADLKIQLGEADEKRYGKDKVITVLAIGVAVLLLYAIILQISLSNAKAKLNVKPKTTRRRAAKQV